jgi:two-component system CheB/CheR fusion protein
MVVFEPIGEKSAPGEQTPAEEGGDAERAPTIADDQNQEISHLKEQLQNTVQDMQSSQEEMKSMNEELQSTNEELQSTNEELTTSKEELQSLNEELLTVNAELQGKIEELTSTNDDMRNLMKSTEIAMLFLDNNLRLRRYTEPTGRIINMIGSDIGRPITDLVINLKDGDLVADVREVLDRLVLKEKQVETKDGRWYHMRIHPYRTSENRIEGVVVSFLDITPVKILELSLEGARAYAENIIAMIREPILVLDSNLRVLTANRAFYRAFNVSPGDTEGQLLYDLGNKQWDIPRLRDLLEKILPENKQLEDFEVEHDFPGIGHRLMHLNARRISADHGEGLILLALEDVTARIPKNPVQDTVKEE